MCCLPLCTAMVRPTMSGATIERRDQVLIGRLSPRAAAASTFFIRWRSMNGPFFSERGTDDILLLCCGSASLQRSLLVAATDDHAVGALVSARLVALGRRVPRADRVTTTAGAAFAAAVRVVDRVHRDSAHSRADPAPALRTRLAQRTQVVLDVRNL